MTERVTRSRLESTDHFRLQVNADRELMAFGYNAMACYLNRESMALIRNQMAETMNKELSHQLTVLITSTPAFRAFLGKYMLEYVDPELRDAAALFLERHGLA